ncbi:nicotinamide phosphoribosyltransferase domain-containing protein [Candidatus Saccharibacteria bacterium]|nr:nicotinamide phosphoribosyltransferase domain-containing protein [Candidatus Saccharibacteria bacterium]
MFKKMTNNPVLWTDGYKFLHKDQYPAGLEWVFETWTARKSRLNGINHAVFFGLQGALAEISLAYKEGFFDRLLSDVMREIKTNFNETFGATNPQLVESYDFSHFEAL